MVEQNTTQVSNDELLTSLSPSALIGTLHVFETGHVRYHPGASQWSSVFDEPPLAEYVKDFKILLAMT